MYICIYIYNIHIYIYMYIYIYTYIYTYIHIGCTSRLGVEQVTLEMASRRENVWGRCTEHRNGLGFQGVFIPCGICGDVGISAKLSPRSWWFRGPSDALRFSVPKMRLNQVKSNSEIGMGKDSFWKAPFLEGFQKMWFFHIYPC